MAGIVNIHIGNTGVGIGKEFWDLERKKHGISRDGALNSDSEFQNTNRLFDENANGIYRPRALFIDSGQGWTKYLTGNDETSFDFRFFHSVSSETGHLFAEYRSEAARECEKQIPDSLRKLTEQCDSLQGFMVYYSCGGGLGAGVASSMFPVLYNEFGKTEVTPVVVYPCRELFQSPIETYNIVLSQSRIIGQSSSVIALDNGAMYDLCKKKLKIRLPRFKDVDQIAAVAVSSFISGINTSEIGSLGKMNRNLANGDRNFLVPNYTFSTEESIHDAVSEEKLAEQAYDPSDLMVRTRQKQRLFASTAVCSGNFQNQSIKEAVYKSLINLDPSLTDWCQASTFCTVNPRPALGLGNIKAAEKTICSFSNTTGISELFSKINKDFRFLFQKRGYIHWYVLNNLDDDLCESGEALYRVEEAYRSDSPL
jgi:tubulin alpha